MALTLQKTKNRTGLSLTCKRAGDSCYCRAFCTKTAWTICAPCTVSDGKTKRLFAGDFSPKYEQIVSGSRPIQDNNFTFIKQSELQHFISMSKRNFKKNFHLFHDFGY